MASHNEFGEKGEELAAGWLVRKGYTILHRNWRQGRYEVDIIALQKHILHFIEVKARSNKAFGLPEEKVTHKKIRNMMNAAAAFLYRYPRWKRVQYDVLAIAPKNEPQEQEDAGYEFFLIEDVSL